MSVLALLKMSPWLAILMLLGIVAYQGGQIHKWHSQNDNCVVARQLDQATYAKAQSDAKAKNDTRLARVKAEQEKVTHEFDNYPAELARLRAELAARLHAQSTAPKGAPGKPTAPDLPYAAPVADDPSRVSIPTDLYVRGAELEFQLEQLEGWVSNQMKIDPNK